MNYPRELRVLSTALLLCSCYSAGTSKYKPAEAYQILGYAQAAYCPNVQAWDCGKVCRGLPTLINITVVTDDHTDGRCYVGYQPTADVIIVSFRGTVATSFENWLSDLESIDLVDSPYCTAKGCQIGDGFTTAYEALRNDTLKALRDLQGIYPTAKVYVTGHSLGASLANVCAADLKTGGNDPDVVITFGSPRSGNAEFSQYLNETRKTRWRLTHHRDPVIHLPQHEFGFCHGATEIFYMNKTGLAHQICDGSGEDPNCSYNFTPEPTATDHLDYLDHPLGSYECPK